MKNSKKYLPEFVYGGIDGTITTFAVVAGVIGASLSSTVILILGFANLFADGFSMAVSNYLSEKSKEELRGEKNKKSLASKKATVTFFSFLLIGFIPLFSFVLAAAVNSPTLFKSQFLYSIILTALALMIIGWFKGVVTQKNKVKSSLQVLVIGGVAAVIAFFVGYFIKTLIG